MKKFFKEYLIFLMLLIGVALISDIYGYWSISGHGITYQSDNLYNDNSIR
jgi:hypothetical protein